MVTLWGNYEGISQRFTALKAEFEAQLEEEARLNRAIVDNLAKVVL
ncbi:hypothetical protein [Escherichia coli]|nr:hypothetical protein [Escherichia coli]